MEIDENLIKKYDKLVKKIVNKYYRIENIRFKYEFEDLEQIGNIGLIKAVKKFDGNKSSFITFAYYMITYEIGQYIRDDKYYLSKRKERMMNNYISLDSKVNVSFEDRNVDFIDFIKFNEAKFEEIENNMLINKLILTLNEDEKKIIYYKYYLEKTQNEISKIMNITQKTVSVKLKNSILKMQKKLKEV